MTASAGTNEVTSSVPRSRRRRASGSRKRKVVAALALTSAVGLGGVAQAGLASAATIGQVDVGPLPVEDGGNQAAGWGRAWDLCRSYYPDTRSVAFHDWYLRPDPTHNRNVAIQVWDCLDTK